MFKKQSDLENERGLEITLNVARYDWYYNLK
jgi:hypothetical protein